MKGKTGTPSFEGQEARLTKKWAGEIHRCWTQPWRFYHTASHMTAMDNYIRDHRHEYENCPGFDMFMECVDLAIKYHDLICNPGDANNEMNSAEAFIHQAKGIIDKEHRNLISHLILATIHTIEQLAGDPLAQFFVKADWNGMMDWRELDTRRVAFLDHWEDGVFKEYQKFPLKMYLEGRRKFLDKAYDDGMITSAVRSYVLHRMESKIYRIGVYPGSFAPFHNGHLDVLEKAMRMFDKVVVARGVNPEKPPRESNVERVLAHVETDSYDWLLADYLASFSDISQARVQVTLIRGIRNGWDLQQEFNLIQYVKESYERKVRGGKLDVILIPCDPSLAHVSSTAIRSLPVEERCPYLPLSTI